MASIYMLAYLDILNIILIMTTEMKGVLYLFPKQASKQVVFKLFNFEYNLKTTENNLIGK